MGIDVDTGGLSSAGVRLGSAPTGAAPAAPSAPGADPVTVWASGYLQAVSASLGATLIHGDTVRATGGTSLVGTSESFTFTDEASAAFFTSTAAANSVPAAAVPAVPNLLDLPDLPAVIAPPVMTGEAWSRLVHAAAPGDWRSAAAQVRAHAATVGAAADTTESSAAGIETSWRDGGLQQAGANTRRHAGWLADSAAELEGLACAFESCADHHDRVTAATPPPDDFDTTIRLAQSAAAAGDVPGYVTAVRRYSELSGLSTEAMSGYHSDVVGTTSMLSTGFKTAPAIHTGPAETTMLNFGPLPEGPMMPTPGVEPDSGGSNYQPDLGLPNYDLGSLSTHETRVVYMHGELAMRELNEQMIRDGLSAEQRAERMFSMRNTLRSWCRDLMEDRALAAQLAATEPNMTWQQMVELKQARGLTGDAVYESIIESATRSRPSVNDALGLDPENPPPLPRGPGVTATTEGGYAEPDDGYGTHLSPEELRDAGFPLDVIGRMIEDAQYDPNDSDNWA